VKEGKWRTQRTARMGTS